MCIIYKSNSTPSIPASKASSISTRPAHLPPRMPCGYSFTHRWTCSVSKIADSVAFLHEGKLLFFKSKDDLIYHYGLLHCGEKLFHQIEHSDILAWRKQDYEYQVLISDHDTFSRKYKNCVIDPATLDDIMLLYIRGERI